MLVTLDILSEEEKYGEDCGDIGGDFGECSRDDFFDICEGESSDQCYFTILEVIPNRHEDYILVGRPESVEVAEHLCEAVSSVYLFGIVRL